MSWVYSTNSNAIVNSNIIQSPLSIWQTAGIASGGSGGT